MGNEKWLVSGTEDGLLWMLLLSSSCKKPLVAHQVVGWGNSSRCCCCEGKVSVGQGKAVVPPKGGIWHVKCASSQACIIGPPPSLCQSAVDIHLYFLKKQPLKMIPMYHICM